MLLQHAPEAEERRHGRGRVPEIDAGGVRDAGRRELEDMLRELNKQALKQRGAEPGAPKEEPFAKAAARPTTASGPCAFGRVVPRPTTSSRAAPGRPQDFVQSVGPTLGMMRHASVAAALSINCPLSPFSLKPEPPSLGSTSTSASSALGSHRDSAAGFAEARGKEKPVFDVLTIRQWFNSMDTDGSGSVDKQEWLAFLRSNHRLKNVLLRGDSDVGSPLGRERDAAEAFHQGREDAREIRRLLRIWKEIDTDASGVLEWQEFVEFFRKSGNLLVYATPNPKERMAELVATFNEEGVSESAMAEFDQLASKHLSGERRRALGLDALRKVEPESQLSARIERLPSATVAGPVPSRRSISELAGVGSGIIMSRA